MPSTVISRSTDLRRLQEEGYDIEIRGGFLLLKDVPYLGTDRKVRRGTLVSQLDLAGDETVAPKTHVVFFTGEHPCDLAGVPIAAISHSSGRQDLVRGLVVHRSFSNKPAGGYADYYHKMTTYVAIIEHPAQAVDPSVTARVGRVIEPTEGESPFMYLDTASSRALINEASDKLRGLRIAIIGVGGTGSYILDLVAKTPVAEIHLFDDDRFFQHNAFRSPGAATVTELRAQPKKVDHFKAKYAAIHRGLVVHSAVANESFAEIRSLDFAFISMDGGPVKAGLVDSLEDAGVPFVVVGMGLELVDGAILGQLCVSAGTKAVAKMRARGRVSFADVPGDYDTNIQISDLNALNAALAVIKWKKMFGFYVDLDHEHHCTYTISGNLIVNDEKV